MIEFALILALQFSADALPLGSHDGACLYPEVLRERAAPSELVTCNRVEVAGNYVAFGLRSWQSQVRFNGSFEGDRMTVDSVTLANGRSIAARGTCEVAYTDGAFSTLSCTAQSNRGAMLANFVRSRINDAR